MSCTVTLGQIVTNLCGRVGITAIDTTAIDNITVRGFMVAGMYNVADSIRSLQRAYFFDFVEIDGELVAVLRGGSSVATIYRTDMVMGHDAKFETVREQGVEFPKKLHIAYANAETDYTPTTQTSERRTDDIKSLSEITIQVPINLEDEDAAQIADKMHKVAWAEQQGTTRFAVSEKFAYITPADIITVEASSGVMKRVRVQKTIFVDGAIHIDAVIDRAASYASAVIAPTPTDPIEPGTNLVGGTSYEIMDLPVLLQTQDTLHLYVSAYGTGDVWHGAVIEQQIGSEWVERARTTYPETMGVTAEELPTHAAGIDETNTLLVTVSDDEIATITQADFDIGGNLALVDDELIQFRDVVAEGDDYRISYLNRGVLNTTPGTQASGSRFVKLVSPTIVPMSSSDIGESITFRVYSVGKAPQSSDETTITFAGNSQIEWTPINPTMELISGDWYFTWSTAKRIGALNNGVVSQHAFGSQIQFTEGAFNHSFDTVGVTELIVTAAMQTTYFGGAVAAWDSALIFTKNTYTGLSDSIAPVDISGDKLLFEDGTGYLMFEDDGGVLLLE